MKQHLLLGFLCLTLLPSPAFASPAIAQPQISNSTLPTLPPQDQQLFEQLLATANERQLHTKPLGQAIEFFALQLLGQPYKAGLLDQTPDEELFLSLTQFDCVLFVESVLAIAHSFRSPIPSDQQFSQRVQALRYRDGQRTNYCSRLHYFSEWLDNNQARGNLQNMTDTLGGIPLKKQLQFMSRHRSSYRQLAQDSTYDCIVQMENRLASLPMHYIPTASIATIENQLQPGDIIAVATAVPHLDVTHTGLIYQETGRPGLIHASPGGSVRLAPNLTQYVSNVDSAIGIMVARPIARSMEAVSTHEQSSP